ncbi:MAG: FAD-binding protein [Thermodesulfobacteriota bacterium]
MKRYREISTDILIIGSEAAGARAALEAAHQARVLMVTKSIMAKSGVTLKAVFSVSAAFGYADPRDNPDVHLRDTVVKGRFLANQRLADIVCHEALERMDELTEWGVPWDRAPDGRYLQTKMYGHTYPRALSVGFGVGIAWMKVLRKMVRRSPNVTVLNDFFISNYLKSSQGEVVGAVGLELKSGEVVAIRSKAVIDCTGGGMHLYKVSAGTPESTADGIAMGYRAGAQLVDMEFVQFFPLAMVTPWVLKEDEGIPSFMRTWLKARLYNSLGERFLERYDPENMEFADRDVLSRAVFTEVKEGRGTENGGVWLDARHLGKEAIQEVVDKMAPNWTLRGINLLEHGLDLREVAAEVSPTSHFFCGGIRVDERWATRLPGLFAAGESVGGVHGANRLPGAAFIETQVSAQRAGKYAVQYAREVGQAEPDSEELTQEVNRISSILRRKQGLRPIQLRKRLQEVMWDKVGIIRNGHDLKLALEEISRMKVEDLPRVCPGIKGRIFNAEWMEALELQNILDAAELIATTALFREESRGGHYREDFPTSRRQWLRNTVIERTDDGPQLTTQPVVVTKVPLEETG